MRLWKGEIREGVGNEFVGEREWFPGWIPGTYPGDLSSWKDRTKRARMLFQRGFAWSF